MDGFRGIVFRDGPTGHRAALVGGPDIWEVIATLKSGKTRGRRRSPLPRSFSTSPTSKRWSRSATTALSPTRSTGASPQHHRRPMKPTRPHNRKGCCAAVKLLLYKQIDGRPTATPATARRSLDRPPVDPLAGEIASSWFEAPPQQAP